MAHEIGAANCGFVWPKIAFTSDLRNIFIHASASSRKDQAVRYINSLSSPVAVTHREFERAIEDFVTSTIARLDAVGKSGSELKELWSILEDERADPESYRYRKLEAQMGFDPDEAPESLVRYLLESSEKIGTGSLDELSAAYRDSIREVDYFESSAGVEGALPRIEKMVGLDTVSAPWKQAVRDARSLRKSIGNESAPIDNSTMFELLGMDKRAETKWDEVVQSGQKASVALNSGGHMKYIPRKKHPHAKRFELGRFIADYGIAADGEWLVETDQSTARQKYQKAFAAEFLCPIDGLVEFLEDNYTDDAIEKASDHFNVSAITIESLLANNGYIDRGAYAESVYIFSNP